MNQRIALYLSGQYPGYYHLPNRLDIIFKIRQLDQSSNFNDTIISQLQGKTDGEYFATLLNVFYDLHTDDDYTKLLDNLKIPLEVRKDPNESKVLVDLPSISKISEYMKNCGETDFSRNIVMPTLQSLGYKEVYYKGAVKESDHGTDFFVVLHNSPGGLSFYTGVQVKSVKMTNGSSSAVGSEYHTLVQEIKSAFSATHTLLNGEEVKIDEMLIFNSKDMRESVIVDLHKAEDFVIKKIKVYPRDATLSLINEHQVKIVI